MALVHLSFQYKTSTLQLQSPSHISDMLPEHSSDQSQEQNCYAQELPGLSSMRENPSFDLLSVQQFIPVIKLKIEN